MTAPLLPDPSALQTAAPPAGLRRTRREDVDQLSADLPGWNQSYDQLTRGPFTGVLQEVWQDGLHLFREYTSTGLRQAGRVDSTIIGFGLPEAQTGRTDFCGALADADALHIFSGSEGFEFHTAPGQKMLCLGIRAEHLSPWLGEEDLRILAPGLRDCRLVPLRPERARALRRHLADGLSGGGLASRAEASRRAQKSRAFLRQAMDLLSGLTNTSQTPPEQAPAARSRRIFHEAVEYALAQIGDEKLSIRHLCDALRVSRRSLHYAFQTHAAMAPECYLRMLRLNRARRMLKAGAPVTKAATQWGFWHLGRFAGAYHALFGELPSVTAARTDC
ncbi:helix-turn-helix domain-containing protein [Xinfangfangia sp. D13-10-4-6]|uniref:helix-turn-helix domain-containing protein n=1 Tax=Pseudogemmobacter hezensis TaxID=2737662 RepID=UPI001551C59C|nr:helix-turn-helix domain-containing protein [Pseudogemmobacter hezensis]NPD14887.1 helix-turn-helix domain-containing protein [Pseudogemmobacter hezensis]